MVVIAEDVLASLPGDWSDQVARAYAVMAAPSPFLMPVPYSVYATVPFFGLHDSLLAVGDDLGASWLALQTMDDLVAALDGADELGLRNWLERLHPRGEGGMFREVRGRRLAEQADRALKQHLLRRGITRLPDKFEFRRDLGETVESPLHRDIERTRLRVQEMVDNNTPIQAIREQLGLDVGRTRREAARQLRQRQWARQDDIAAWRQRMEDTNDPAEAERLQVMIDRAERELDPMIQYHENPGKEPFFYDVPPPIEPRPQQVYPSVARRGVIQGRGQEPLGTQPELRPLPDYGRGVRYAPPTPEDQARLDEMEQEREALQREAEERKARWAERRAAFERFGKRVAPV